MKNVDSINRSVLDLWNEYCRPEDRPPLLYPPVSEGGILFVGANPAWIEGGTVKTFSELLEDRVAVDALIAEERDVRETYRYFAPCRKIAEENKIRWDHVDWFFIRETNQNALERQVLKKPANWDSPVELTPFGKGQIKLAKKLMTACKPKIIVVINALASKVARTVLELHDALIDNDGLYSVEISGKSTPVIFSGMLTGQRALDKGSFERLRWHINKTLSKRSSEN